MPAKRKRKNNRRTRTKKKNNKSFVGFLLFIFLVLFLVYILFSSKVWDKQQKLVLLTSSDSGPVYINVFDPVGKTKTAISIPDDMQVTAARDYGTWKLKGLRNLSKNEKVGNRLIAESVMYDLSVPIDAWGDGSLEGLVKGGLAGLRALFSSKDTNLRFGDRLKIYVFSMSIKNFERKDINISDYTAVRKTKLIDGSVGYVVSGDLPRSFYAIFAEPLFSDEQNTVKIIDKTEKREASKKIGSVMEVIGVKIASLVTEVDDKNLDCIVSGNNVDKVKLAAKVFGCGYKIKDVGSYTLEVSVGDRFVY